MEYTLESLGTWNEKIEALAKDIGLNFYSQEFEIIGYKDMLAGVVAGDSAQNFGWTARQTYIALGVGLVAAAEEGVDATPMEGFSTEALDGILGLAEQNLGSTIIMTLGYRDVANDYLASATKVRKSKSDLFIFK